MGNNKVLKELGAAESGLGTGGASILITFLLGLWPVTESAVPLLPTLIPLSVFSIAPPTLPSQPASPASSWEWKVSRVDGEYLVALAHTGAALSPVVGWGAAEADGWAVMLG